MNNDVSKLQAAEAHKALSVESRRKILDFIISKGPLSLEELSSMTGLKTITLRHHMAALGKAGLVNSFLRSDGPYKPKLYYKITDKYLDLGFPKRQYELLAQGLIKNLKENKGEKPTVSLLRKVGGKFGQDMMRTLSTQHRINRWNLKLFEEYVVPEIGKFVGVPVEFTKRRNGSLVLKVSNCVFYEISKVHPDIICEGHKAFHQALANHIGKYNVQLEGCIAKGEKTCTTILKKR